MSAEDLLISVPAAALWATENRTINFPAERLGPAPCSSLLRDCIKIQYLRNRTSTQIHWILPFYKSRYVHIQRRFCRCMSCCLLELYLSQSVCFFLKSNIFPQFFHCHLFHLEAEGTSFFDAELQTRSCAYLRCPNQDWYKLQPCS